MLRKTPYITSGTIQEIVELHNKGIILKHFRRRDLVLKICEGCLTASLNIESCLDDVYLEKDSELTENEIIVRLMRLF